MELTLQQINSITQGAETIKEENGAIWFSRFTDEELALYTAREGFECRARGTAGVQMEFTTDANELFLQVTTPQGDFYHSFFAYDILVDEKRVGQLRNFEGEPACGAYSKAVIPTEHPSGRFPLGGGTKTVRIVFPWSMGLGIEKMELVGATFAKPVKRQRKLLIYGDSITQGSCSLYPSLTYAAQITQWLQADSVNKGVGSEAYFPELAEAATAAEPDYITVSYGANDWCTFTKEEFAQKCRAFWTALERKYPNARKFALSPIYYPSTPVKCFGPFEDITKIIAEVVKEFPEVVFIDCTEFASRDPAHFGDGWIHPSHEGFTRFARNLQKAMEPYI